jgi:hypothetical protein
VPLFESRQHDLERLSDLLPIAGARRQLDQPARGLGRAGLYAEHALVQPPGALELAR